MAGSLNVDKRPIVNSGGIIYSTTSMNTNKCSGHEPPDVFCGLASLIVEGRVPRPDGGKDGRGVHHEEGPHAIKHHGPGGNILHGHECSDDDYMCKKDENFRKHMLLLWQNNVPVSIEVLLCSDCRVGRQKANSVEYSTIPEPGSILLEQWTVSISNNFKRKEQRTTVGGITPTLGNIDQHTITSRGLFQAVRSYLHFSQLSAWYDSFRGTAPSSVLYRITIPGEAFASKFTCQPEHHYFPPAAVGSMALVNVAVRSYPRTDKIPKVFCTHNTTDVTTHSPTGLSSSPSTGDILASDSSSTSISPTCGRSGNNGDQTTDLKSLTPITHATNVEDNKLAMAGSLSWKETERLETDLRRMTLVKNKMTECTLTNTTGVTSAIPRSDSMDSMLGDSLLDPPQDLQKMPPKRYQSPSRCGSPSIEAPDHLLFRSHYHYNENASNVSQFYSTVGTATKNSESARNRLARQDLLRRRDIGQTLGISGSCHGLHPRMLLSIGQNQPRLSLPPKTVAPVVNPVLSTSGPYRAFPPERGMRQFTPFMQRTPCSHSVVPKPCGLSEEMGPLSQLVDRMQVKCNISGKHICKYEAQGGEYDMCSNIGTQDIDKAPYNKQIYGVEGTAYSDMTEDEKLKQETQPYLSNSSRPLTESTPSFILGGAKKKSAISLNQANKRDDQIRSPISTRNRHYKQIESDEDDTGIEVAEYDITDINNTLLARRLPMDYEAANKQINERQTISQKELDDILDGLAPEKDKCSSRRSSLKDEDRLFPHKCKCTSGSSQSKIDLLDQGCPKSAIPKPPIITQVYRAETETPPLVSSPSLHVKSAKRSGNRGPHSPVSAKALDKADILMGAILRTCERNKHLETEDDFLSTDNSSSSRGDSYSLGEIRKSPDERKNSAGDADDEDEEGENTSSDNGSSILSSPTSSDEEETHFGPSNKSDKTHWYKHNSRGISNRGRQKKVPATFSGRKLSDTSSSSLCLSGQLIPSTKSSMIIPPVTLNHLYPDPFPPTDYARNQIICDTEETCPSSQQCFIPQGDENKKEEDIGYRQLRHNIIIRSDENKAETCQYTAILESSKKLNSDNLLSENSMVNVRDTFQMDSGNISFMSLQEKEVHKYIGPNFTSVTTNSVQTKDSQKCQDGSDTKNYEEYIDNNKMNYPNQGSVGFTRIRSVSENVHQFSSKTAVKEREFFTENTPVQGNLIHSQNQYDGKQKNNGTKPNIDLIKHSNGANFEPLDISTWFDDNMDSSIRNGDRYQYDCDKENDCQDSAILENQNQKVFANDGKFKHVSNVSTSKEASTNDATTNINNGISIPTMVQKDYFRKTLNSATSMVFHRKTGLPLSSSPAPLRKGKHDFGYDSSINTPTAIKRALYITSNSTGGSSKGNKKYPARRFNLELNPSDNDDGSQEVEDPIGTEELEDYESDKAILYRSKKKRQGTTPIDEDIFCKRNTSFKGIRVLSASAPAAVSSQGTTANNLLGTFEESVLNGRLEPVSTVEGFTAEIGASGSFHPKHKTVPVTVFFYNMCCDNSPSISSPYLGHINLGKKGYRVPQSGTIQVTLFNPLGTVVKMFVVMYDLNDMPPNSQTFIRQRTFYMPTSDSICENDRDAMEISRDGSLPVGASQKWLRYLVHLRFASSKSGKIYLHTDVRMIIFRKSDLDTATDHNTTPGKLGGFELRSFTNGPSNPKFSPRKINFRQEE